MVQERGGRPEVEDMDWERRFQQETGIAGDIAALAEPVLEDMGFRLVRVVVSGRDGGTVQIMAERPDGTFTVGDCTAVSRRLSPLLDVHDPLPGAYRLEVSSPGLARPLVRPSDFRKWVGHDAKIKLKETVDGRRRFRGRIEDVVDGEVHLAVVLTAGEPETVLGFPFHMLEEAKLVMTDALLAVGAAETASGGPSQSEEPGT